MVASWWSRFNMRKSSPPKAHYGNTEYTETARNVRLNPGSPEARR
jgi:hypothetical protein